MLKYIIGLSISLGQIYFNTASAVSNVTCNWEPSHQLITKPSLADVTETGLNRSWEEYNCYHDTDNIKHCSYKFVWTIANRIYSINQSVKVACVNFGNQTERVSYNFNRSKEVPEYSYAWKNLTMSISGASSQLNLSALENIDTDKIFLWGSVNLAPCQKNCESMETAWPRYTANLTLNFTVRPKALEIDGNDSPYYNLQDSVGFIWMSFGNSNMMAWSTVNSNPIISICGLAGKTICQTGSGANIGGGSIPPPIKQCTLTIVTPDFVTFQPISSDDLSRDRVRTEDFTLTVIKGPDQSTPCMGSAYNLPGEIKTQGGYSISSTFWGINHSSGTPQGIGLKLYDLGKGSYLRFNYQYPSFISDISSISESKRIRAEISATTKDLKKIKDGTYSQVLTFEVKMP